MMTARQSLPSPEEITRVVLPNGITVLARPNPDSLSVVISGYLPCGSLFDPDEKLGLADFTASALLRGTEKHDFQQIFEILESAGASLSFNAGAHMAGFNGHALAEDLPLLLGLLAEALRGPVFPPEQVERLRSQLLTGLDMRAQDTAAMASLTFDQIVFAGHPYARPEDGWPETIRAITREDIVGFHQRCYGPRGLALVIVGAVDPARAVREVERFLGDWENKEQPDSPTLPSPEPLQKTVRRKVNIPGKSQADLIIGCIGPRRNSPDFMAALLGNSALGRFGLGGRIGEVVREKAGLAYYAYSSLNAGAYAGSWDVSAGVNPAHVRRATELISKEIARFVEDGITAEELADSQANLIGRLPLSLESNSGVAAALLNIERYGLGLDYYCRYADLVRAVTAEEVLTTARRYWHLDRLAIAVAGP